VLCLATFAGDRIIESGQQYISSFELTNWYSNRVIMQLWFILWFVLAAQQNIPHHFRSFPNFSGY